MTIDQRLDALDRIEQKLDKLLLLMGCRQQTAQVDDMKTVLVTSGPDALKDFVRNMPKSRKGKGEL